MFNRYAEGKILIYTLIMTLLLSALLLNVCEMQWLQTKIAQNYYQKNAATQKAYFKMNALAKALVENKPLPYPARISYYDFIPFSLDVDDYGHYIYKIELEYETDSVVCEYLSTFVSTLFSPDERCDEHI